MRTRPVHKTTQKGDDFVDIARSEAVEADLGRFIERRASREPDPDYREELWKESVQRYTARRREEMRAAWTSYHEGQAERHRATLQALIEHHEEQAAKLVEVKPKGDGA
jgi:hypothetical protein